MKTGFKINLAYTIVDENGYSVDIKTFCSKNTVRGYLKAIDKGQFLNFFETEQAAQKQAKKSARPSNIITVQFENISTDAMYRGLGANITSFDFKAGKLWVESKNNPNDWGYDYRKIVKVEK
jgi:hypothetical protein